MTVEEWRRVPGYSLYEASDQGRVRSWNPRRGAAQPHILAPSPGIDGYLQSTLRSDAGPKKKVTVHRLVGEAFFGPLPDGQVTRHLDGNKMNNALSNLLYGTVSENVYDAVRHGTWGPSSKTHCPQGHAYDEANTIRQGGKRSCRTCRREQWRAHNWKRRGRSTAPSTEARVAS